jgi:hypothetical protein
MIRGIKFRRYAKNTLKGFADLELVRTGIIIHDCCWHRHENGSEWVSFPARSYTDKTGATQWQRIIDFAADAHEEREAFRKQALAAIHEFTAEEEVS